MSSTTSSEPLSWPAEWSTGRARWYLAIAWMTVLALVSFGSAALVRGGAYDPAVKYFLLFGFVFVLTVVVGYDSRIRRRRGSLRGVRTGADTTGRPATALRYSWLGFAGSIALCLLMALFLGLAAYDLGSSPEVTAPAAAGAVFGLGALFFLIFPAQALAGRVARGRVLLSAAGIEHRSWGFRSWLPWDGVLRVSAVSADGPQVWVRAAANRIEHRQLAWLCGKPPSEPGVLVEGRMLGVDPVLVLRMLEFYAARPDRRAELGTPTALQRARAGAFGR